MNVSEDCVADSDLVFPRCIYHGPLAKGCESSDWEKEKADGWTLTPDPAYWGGDGSVVAEPVTPTPDEATAVKAPEPILRGKRR